MPGAVSLHATSCRHGALTREANLSGEQSAVDGICEHADVVLQDGLTIRDNIPDAEAVVFDEPGIVERAKLVAESGHLGTSDVSNIKTLVGEASTAEVPLLVRLGTTETFAVRHHNNRSVPGGWAHVQTTGIALIARAPGSSTQRSARRRSTNNAELQCKVIMTYAGVALRAVYAVSMFSISENTQPAATSWCLVDQRVNPLSIRKYTGE